MGASQKNIKELFFKLSIVLKLYYQRTKIQPAAGDGRSSTKVVLPENENPAGRQRRPFQY